MDGRCDEYCRGCVHLNKLDCYGWFNMYAWYCNYICDEKHSRPCPAGKGCTEKKTAGRKRRKQTCQ